VLGSNLFSEVCHRFPLPADSTSIRPEPPPSKCFPIHQSRRLSTTRTSLLFWDHSWWLPNGAFGCSASASQSEPHFPVFLFSVIRSGLLLFSPFALCRAWCRVMPPTCPPLCPCSVSDCLREQTRQAALLPEALGHEFASNPVWILPICSVLIVTFCHTVTQCAEHKPYVSVYRKAYI
jgi:hypothetical protein